MNADRFLKINAAAAGAASAALVRLTGRPIVVKLKRAELMDGEEPPGPGLGEDSAGVSLDITGGMHGAALLCFPMLSARLLVGPLVGDRGAGEEFTAMERSALEEIGNIICGSYVTVLSNEIKTKIIPGIPTLLFGVFESMYEDAVARLPNEERRALVIEVEIELAGKVVIGRLLLFLETEKLLEV